MNKKILITLIGLTFGLASVRAQDWVQMMQDPSVNFYDVQKAFNKYWEKNERKTALRKLIGGKESQTAEENYEKYKRWEYFTEARVYPSGDRSLINKGADEIARMFKANQKSSTAMSMAGNWTLLGPTTTTSSGGGAGRLNCVRFDPSNPNTIYVGAPAGGLWKSTNGGLNWTTTTDRLAVIGISDVAVDPTDSKTVYIATGDGDAGDTYSNGVLKTTDGGLTWNPTGLNFNIPNTRLVYRLAINPSNHLMIIAATSAGIFKSVDGGGTWAKCLNIPTREVVFKPGDPSVVYAVSSSTFYRSVDGGNTFASVITGLPLSSTVCRLAIAVTAADPTYVYVLGSTASTYTFKGLYLSTDQGKTFTAQSTTPNVLGFSSTGNDNQGQGWYTLSIAASPVNKNEIIVGGVNVWRSTNAGVSWTLNASWTGGGGAPYVHADIHMLSYLPGSGTTAFAACDGGFFKTSSNGSNWSDLSNGLQIGEMYRLGCSQTNANIVIQGWQDNGTNEYNAGTWGQVYGGDGMECFIDYSNANYMYCETYNGNLQRSTNGGGFFGTITSGITGTGAWVTPWLIDPVTPATLYAGFQDVWKSTNRGTNWTKISSMGGTLTILNVAPSNPAYIYAGGTSNLSMTSNGGTTWTNLTTTLPGNGSLTHVEVSATDPNTIWITYSGYNANSKVFKSKDGGHTWTNLSASLPNLPVNCVVNQSGSPDGVYIGTDVGVYYRDTTMANWAFFSNGLPNVKVDELEIQKSAKKLRAATYGRGLWETSLYDPTSTLPLANFNSDIQTGCPGMSVQFTDLSTNNPTSWSWVFSGGTPSTSSSQNPVVVFNTPGSYNLVKLTATNANGSDSVTKYSYIGVSPQSPPVISRNGKDTVCAGDLLVLTSSFGNTYSWSPNGSPNPVFAPTVTGSYTVSVTDGFGCVCTSTPMSVVINPLPVVTITKHGDTLTSNFATGNQWYMGATAIAGATSQTYIESLIGSYTDHVTNANGCKGVSNAMTGIHEDQELQNSMSVFPNPNDGHFLLEVTLSDKADYTLRITDVTGREVFSEKLNSSSPGQRTLDLSTYGKGVYMLEISGSKGRATKKIIIY
jgi:PKD repeat protein